MVLRAVAAGFRGCATLQAHPLGAEPCTAAAQAQAEVTGNPGCGGRPSDRVVGSPDYAALAEKERQMISRRTKDALAAARARGVILGGMREKSLELQAEAEARAEELRSVFVELVGLSHRAAARTLNERGVKTATGKPWSPVTVTRVRQRLGLI